MKFFEEFQIRKSNINDILDVEDAHRRSIREICSKDYLPDEIESWSNINYDENRFKISIEDEFHLVVERNGKIQGFCHAKNHGNGMGEIMGLYLAPEVIGLGAGKAIFDEALEYLKREEVKKIVISGTISAKGFYERMGFHAIGPEKKINIRGKEITCYSMERKL